MTDDMPQRFVDEKKLCTQSRRDFILFGAGAFATLAGIWWISPLASKKRIFGEHATDFLDTAAARFGLTKEFNPSTWFRMPTRYIGLWPDWFGIHVPPMVRLNQIGFLYYDPDPTISQSTEEFLRRHPAVVLATGGSASFGSSR